MPLSLSRAASAGADDISDPEQKFVQIEVWDHKLVKQFRGRVDVPLKQVLDNQRVKDSFRSALLSDSPSLQSCAQEVLVTETGLGR